MVMYVSELDREVSCCQMPLICSAPQLTGWAQEEIAAISFHDLRVCKSLSKNLERMIHGCGRSFSDKCGHAGRQAATRLFHRADFTEQVLLQGHIHQTLQRIQEYNIQEQRTDDLSDGKQNLYDGRHPSRLLALQDTTEIDLTTHVGMEGLGPLAGRNKKGLLMHDSLLVTPTGLPLGVPYYKIWARDAEQAGIKHERSKRPTNDKESYKWIEGLAGIEKAVPEGQALLVIQDREGDIYDLLAAPRRPTTQLLVRCFHPRKVQTKDKKKPTLFEYIEGIACCAQHEIELPRRSATLNQGAKEAVKGRTAKVELRYTRVRIKATAGATLSKKEVPYLTLSLIQVAEATPSALSDAEAMSLEATTDPSKPVRWTLLCTEEITSAEQAWQMAQYYKLRWLIERFHFVLKSGCGAEEMQFDDAETAKKALGMYAIVSWRLLWLMHMVRANPDAPASSIADSASISALKAMTKRRVTTANDFLVAVGTLGGYTYYPKNPQPGIKAIWRGLRRLEDITLAFQAGRNSRQEL